MNNKVKSFSSARSFYNLLEIVTNESSNSLIFLNPVKGGFNCYSSGVIGFLPRKQGDFLVSLSLLSLKSGSDKKEIFSNLNYVLSKKILYQVLFWIKIATLVG